MNFSERLSGDLRQWADYYAHKAACTVGARSTSLTFTIAVRERHTQFASVFGDISNDRATDGMLRPPPVT